MAAAAAAGWSAAAAAARLLRAAPRPGGAPPLRLRAAAWSSAAPPPAAEEERRAAMAGLREEAASVGGAGPAPGPGPGPELPEGTAAMGAGVAGATSFVQSRAAEEAAPAPEDRPPVAVDTLRLYKGLTEAGLTAVHADRLTYLLTNLLAENSSNFARVYASKVELEKVELLQSSQRQLLEAELIKREDLGMSSLRLELENVKDDIGRVQTEVKFELDKLVSGHRLDMSLEKGRIREETQSTVTQIAEIESKFDRDINALKTNIEAAKNDVIKYSIGVIASSLAVGLAFLRLM